MSIHKTNRNAKHENSLSLSDKRCHEISERKKVCWTKSLFERKLIDCSPPPPPPPPFSNHNDEAREGNQRYLDILFEVFLLPLDGVYLSRGKRKGFVIDRENVYFYSTKFRFISFKLAMFVSSYLILYRTIKFKILPRTCIASVIMMTCVLLDLWFTSRNLRKCFLSNYSWN